MQRDKQDLIARLRKIEGQLRGIQKMVEQDRYCVDILDQIAAVRAALNRVGLSLMESHTRGCVADAIREERGDDAIDELMHVVMKFTK